MPVSLNEILEKLHEILNVKPGKVRGELVRKFDDIIFLRDDIEVSDNIEDVLIDLAHELEYYVSDPIWRKENRTYFGDEELVHKINTALLKINELRN